MPSFDVVSKIDHHEVANAVDQANREIANRFDFKDSDATFEVKENTITLTAPNDFQLKQMHDILTTRWTKRQLDLKALHFKDNIEKNLHQAKQTADIKEGIDKDIAKKITTFVKNSKVKVQAQIQGDHVRITGKNRDDLQQMIAMLRKEDFGLPLQFENFRD